jgi:hypothetical protein
LISALSGSEWATSRPAALRPGGNCGTDWAPEQVWKFWRTENPFDSAESSHGPSVCSMSQCFTKQQGAFALLWGASDCASVT